MLGNITLGQYIAGESPVHKLNPSCKIIAVMITSGGILLQPGIQGLLISGGVVLLAMMFAGKASFYAFRGLKPLLFLVGFSFLFQAFSIPGEPVLTLGKFDITKQGLEKASLMAGRLLYIVLLASVLTITTSPIALTHGLEKILQPFKKIGIPVRELAVMMTIALRFIPTLINEADTIIKAQRSRGSDLTSGGFTKRMKALIPFIVPLLAGSLRRAEELAMAMEARCYRGDIKRTTMYRMTVGRGDVLAVLLSSIFAIEAVILRLAGW
ncbi:MAG: energy-coupling factor transporter transmembrane protein EcfT [Desulfotomaculum sp.]|nr:energy-coupling factor transporter transmembrane protein EcfT [Desulfotomaculum sp.]